MKKNYLPLLITLILLTLIEIVYYLTTQSFLPCLIRKLTNYYCPACGITRMFLSIFKLDFYQAFRYNAYAFTILLFMPLIILVEILLKNNKNILKKVNITLFSVFIFSFILFGVFRNFEFFSYFLPTIVK